VRFRNLLSSRTPRPYAHRPGQATSVTRSTLAVVGGHSRNLAQPAQLYSGDSGHL